MSSSADPYWEKVAERRNVERDEKLKKDVLKSEWMNISNKKTRSRPSGNATWSRK